jgi:hypothetical protein
MFVEEWRLQRGDAPLHHVAIVDDWPREQYLYPEFLLFQQLFRRHGIEASIHSPEELRSSEKALWAGKSRIDLIYNRLTDFSISLPVHAAVREAYLNDQVVVTPHPRAHALYADKRNLAVLTDRVQLRDWGVPDAVIETLINGVPETRLVDAATADELWANRRKFFFKPAAGFGSRGAYRGEKITRRVWQEVSSGGYVAQAFVPPSQRVIGDAAVPLALKLDIRNYVYNGRVLLLAARLYQGQTTNFRTQGGGFAPVFTKQCSPTAMEDATRGIPEQALSG